ncbi:MAG: hypothetical protein EOO70_07485 [Myxococcaceae bacterium]|nr:MAG: hypothetical protein EOO70_07485 [Myxococcaceae bacterium]
MRLHIAAVIYCVFQSLLLGVGVVLTSLLVESGYGQLRALTNCAIVSLVLAAPLAWEAAVLLMSPKERLEL